IHKALPNSEMPAVQQSADILFLPLAFDSPYPDIIRTSAPGKIGEYLASEKPVLVHAPKDSFIAWYFSKNRCGDVVSENNPDTLAEHVVRLVRDDEYRRELARNAYILARDQFDAGSAREKFLAIINNKTGS
ncbi:MAG: glycosyltransferase, partial [Methanoregula sp.]|nr:glycosyltransferase [Methanoregula sp.]